MDSEKSEMLLRDIAKEIEKLRKTFEVTANVKTGRKIDGMDLVGAGVDTMIAGMGAFFVRPGGPLAAAVLGTMGAGLVGRGFWIDGKDETVSRGFTLNEALDAYKKNLRTKGSEDVKNAATFENEAILAELTTAWENLATKWNLIKDFTGTSVDPARSQEVLAGLRAIRDVLQEISINTGDPEVTKQHAQIKEFLARSTPTDPAVPFFGEAGKPQGGGRVFPRTPPAPFFGEGGEPRFLGPSPRRGGSPRDYQLVSLGTSDANPISEYMEQIAEKAKVAMQEFASLGDQVDTFDELTGKMATRIADANVQLAGQADWLTAVGGLLPGVGQRIADLFDSGIEGAEDLDRAVAAMGERFLDAFEGAIQRGESLRDVLKSLGRDLAELALNEVKTDGFGIFGKLGSLFTSAVLPAAGGQSGPHKGAKGLVFTNARLDGFAKGAAFDMGARIDKFANGSAFLNTVVNRPTLFPLANGAGLMGEDGPEAVVPLTRMANGNLGVSMSGAGAGAAGPNITYNIDARLAA